MSKVPLDASDPSAQERRRAPRVRLDLPVAVPVHLRSDMGSHRGVARNVSEGGMLVEVEETPPIGSVVEVTILAGYGLRPVEESYTFIAEVRHQVAWSFIAKAGRARLKGIGLRFLSSEPSAPRNQWLH